MKIKVTKLDDLDFVAAQVRKMIDSFGGCVVEIARENKQRTITQNASLHKYFELISTEMNDAGFSQRQLIGQFKDGFELPVTAPMIKDIYREVGKAMFKIKSTKDLTTKQIQEVYLVVDKRFAEITGVTVAWPSSEPPVYEGAR